MSFVLSTINRRRHVVVALQMLGAIAVAASVSGCNTVRETTASIPNDYRKRHQIGIREGDRTVHVFIGRNRGALTPAQRGDVMSFAKDWRTEATGGIVIDIPAGTGNEMSASQAAREIRATLAAMGVPPHGITIRPYQPRDEAKLATIRLNYPRIMADAGPCGLWPDDIGTSSPTYTENKPYWNFGCANQRNLAAMVDNPADLVQPRGEISASAQRRSFMLDKYRKGDNTSTNYPNADKGKLSDVGK